MANWKKRCIVGDETLRRQWPRRTALGFLHQRRVESARHRQQLRTASHPFFRSSRTFCKRIHWTGDHGLARAVVVCDDDGRAGDLLCDILTAGQPPPPCRRCDSSQALCMARPRIAESLKKLFPRDHSRRVQRGVFAVAVARHESRVSRQARESTSRKPQLNAPIAGWAIEVCESSSTARFCCSWEKQRGWIEVLRQSLWKRPDKQRSAWARPPQLPEIKSCFPRRVRILRALSGKEKCHLAACGASSVSRIRM